MTQDTQAPNDAETRALLYGALGGDDGSEWIRTASIHDLVAALIRSRDLWRDSADAMTHEHDKANHKAALLQRTVDRYLPCPDHRDKVDGRCYVCALETATRERDDQLQYAQNNYDLYLAAAAERDELLSRLAAQAATIASAEDAPACAAHTAAPDAPGVGLGDER